MAKPPTLDALIRDLEHRPPAGRIELRDAVLEHGPAAVSALARLVERAPDLGASVVAWLEVLARRDPASRPSSVASLRQASIAGPSEHVRRHAAGALDRLGVTAPRVHTGKSVALPASAGTQWAGFGAHEFGRNAGTSWRSVDGRESLAPILTRVLRGRNDGFRSFGVDRSPEVHFALASRYRSDPTSRFTASKLVVYAHGPTEEYPQTLAQVVVGWYIERGNGVPPYDSPDDASRWDWPLFLGALERGRIAALVALEPHALGGSSPRRRTVSSC